MRGETKGSASDAGTSPLLIRTTVPDVPRPRESICEKSQGRRRGIKVPEATPKNQFRIEGGVVWLKLTKGRETCVDLADWSDVSKRRWCALEGRRTFYAVSGKPAQYLHSFLLGRPRVDHESGDGLDNRRLNLRPASVIENGQNRRKQSSKSTSLFKGVSWDKCKHKWQVRIYANKRSSFIGLFDDEVEAAKAYDKKAKELFGEFARPNFPEAK